MLGPKPPPHWTWEAYLDWEASQPFCYKLPELGLESNAQ